MASTDPSTRLFARAAAGAAVAAGAAMILAAVPVAVSDWLERPGDPVLSRLQDEEAANESGLRRLVQSREAAMRWRQTAGRHADIALGRLILGEFPGPDQTDDHLVEVETSLTRSLSLAPMNPYGWMRLVQARYACGAVPSDIAPPLRLALRSGPHEDRRHAMLLLMVETSLGVWDQLLDDERGLIADKARYSWNRDARGTARAAGRADRADLLADILEL